MKQTCDLFTANDISCLVDGELSENRRRSLVEHLDQCGDCRSVYEAYMSLSNHFSRQLDVQMQVNGLGNDTEEVERHIAKLAEERQSCHRPHVFGLLEKHAFLKLGMMSLLIGIGFFLIHGNPLSMISTGTGPSAIVKSVDTDYTCVMIIETMDKKHTIIWLSET